VTQAELEEDALASYLLAVVTIGEQVRAVYTQGADRLFEASGAPAAHAAIADLMRPLGMAARSRPRVTGLQEE